MNNELTKGAEINDFIKSNQDLFSDIKNFKSMLLPSELLVLKYFIKVGRPLTIREIYRQTTSAIFQIIFNNAADNTSNPFYFIVNELSGEGYGNVLLNKSDREKVLKRWLKETYGKEEVEVNEIEYKILKEFKFKVVSYDKIQGIFNKFLKLGLIVRRNMSSTNKGIFYTLNPLFTEKFKAKLPDILKI